MTPTMPTISRIQATSPPEPGPGVRPTVPWRAIGASAGILGGETLASYLRPGLGEALAAADSIIPLAIVLILLTVILRGSDQTVERVFRLLRWAANRPEPPAPNAD